MIRLVQILGCTGIGLVVVTIGLGLFLGLIKLLYRLISWLMESSFFSVYLPLAFVFVGLVSLMVFSCYSLGQFIVGIISQ